MPRYDFECIECNILVELVLAVDSQTPRCINCGKTLKRLWSAPAIHFKGDGWAGKK